MKASYWLTRDVKKLRGMIWSALLLRVRRLCRLENSVYSSGGIEKAPPVSFVHRLSRNSVNSFEVSTSEEATSGPTRGNVSAKASTSQTNPSRAFLMVGLASSGFGVSFRFGAGFLAVGFPR